MREQDREHWEITRAKGMIRFIITSGIIKFGISMTIICALIDYVHVQDLDSAYFGQAFFGNIPTIVGRALFSGVGFGLIFWFWMEKDYQKLN